MTRVSQAELYDNRDVIKQIYDAKGASEAAEQAATDAASSATAAQSSADAAAREAVAAGDLAQSAADDAAKVNQFDSRIKSSVTHISTTGTADGVSIGYATDGKPSPLTVVDIPVLSGMGAGVVTPAQMQDISDQLDTLGRGQDAIKTEYLKRHAIHEEQDITGRVDFKISPYVPTLKSNEYADRNGTRAYNAASAAADPVLMKTVGVQNVNARILNKNFSSKVISDLDISAPPERIQATYSSVVDDTVNHKNIINHVVVRNASAYIDQMYIRNENGPSDVMLSVISYHDGTCEMTLKRPNGSTVKIVERG